MLAIKFRWKRRCSKHPRFNPAKGGRGAVKGGCRFCQALCDVYEQAVRLETLAGRADHVLDGKLELPEPSSAPDTRQLGLFEAIA
jgi:hypothetical protein